VIAALEAIKKRNIQSEVILMTASGKIKDAVEATKAGAYNFIEKNQNMDEELKLTIRQAVEQLEVRTRRSKSLSKPGKTVKYTICKKITDTGTV